MRSHKGYEGKTPRLRVGHLTQAKKFAIAQLLDTYTTLLSPAGIGETKVTYHSIL
ncbi:hypothetical protein [Coleofasciculus sp. G2-EDA-02]|uniref:hypothetical protein n=1 Tax=Coleofasciculus sp. G2-EDA-02 TaxID=3069529 RepID=UPI0032F1B45B